MPEPGEEVFGEADLAPPAWEVRARRFARVDRAAASVAALALGTWLGGLIALGACAAPMVFALAPYPYSADAMGAAFARFDQLAVGCAVAVLACEAARTWLDMRSPPRGRAGRLRRYLGMLAALSAIYSATQLTPPILRLHRDGVRRNVGPEGERLERLHRRAELVGKLDVPLAALLVVLHVVTVRSPHEEEEAEAPLPPGKR